MTGYLARAMTRIPSGTQTYSKSPTRFPVGAPDCIVSGNGAYVIDADGRQWLDCVSGLGSVILGHCDPDVDAAVAMQLSRGVSFPLATELELHLAERICRLIPSAELVRFAKNGADACAAAVRIARDVTLRQDVLSIGYHGYHDYTIGHQNPRGVPNDARYRLHTVPYNDREGLRNMIASIRPACLIMEPIVATQPESPRLGYLQYARDLCTEFKTLLVFDEVVTFGRMMEGSAQRYFGVTPDLTALGKCLANGLALSAVVGKAEYMRRLEQGVFFSTTFGGETLGLAAGIATLDKMDRENVSTKVNERGAVLRAQVEFAAASCGTDDRLTIAGYPSRLVFQWADAEDAKVFGESMIRSGILFAGYVNLTLAWTGFEVERFAAASREAFEVVAQRTVKAAA